MATDFSDVELLAYLDEALSVERMAAIEAALRGSASLRDRLAESCAAREDDGPTVSEVWRRGRLSCPSRQQLGSYLLGALAPEWHDYVAFHLDTVGCRYCVANLEDLRTASQTSTEVERRRRKYLESSAGHVPRHEP